MTYLDNNTATKPSQTVILAMMPYFEEHYASPSCPHAMGQELLRPIEKALHAIYHLAGAKEDDLFVFTSSYSESITQVIHSVYEQVARQTGKTHFITSTIGDAATIYALSKLEEEGCALQMAKVSKEGYVPLDSIIEAITPRTCLISLPLASALTGVIQPVYDIAALCKERGILLHIDVTHALGKLLVDFAELGADYLTFNGEQLHAPKGTGGLFARKGTPLIPLIAGDGQETRFRGGPINVPLEIALGQACIEAEQSSTLYCSEVARLRDLFEERIIQQCPEASVLFKESERLPTTSAIAFYGIRSEALLYALSKKGVFATMGGGCEQHIERVVEASGIDHIIASCTLSFSLSKFTTEHDIEKAATIIGEAIVRLRKLSKTLL